MVLGPGKESGTEKDLLSSDIRVLLVDDNKVNQFLGKRILNNLGVMNVELAGSGQEALEKLGKSEFDVLLTDVEMPGMNGYELCKTIRMGEAEGRHLTIIALTANASNEDMENASRAGIDDYLTKPYSPQDLLEMLKKYSGYRDSMSEITAPASVPNGGFSHLYSAFRNNKNDIKHFLIMLSRQIPQLMEEINAGISSGDINKAFHSAHKLKSPVKMLAPAELAENFGAFTEKLRENYSSDQAAAEYMHLEPGLQSLLYMVNAEIEKQD